MYDGHIYCEEYGNIKDILADIMNGDDTETDVQELADRIQELYDDGKMQATQYDDLMRYVDELL